MVNAIQLDKDKFKARDDRYREAFSKGVQNANALMGGGRGGLGGLGGGNVGWKTMAGNLVGQLLMGGLLGYLLNKDKGGSDSSTQGNGQPAPAPNAATGRGGTDASGLSYYPMGDEGQAAAEAAWNSQPAPTPNMATGKGGTDVIGTAYYPSGKYTGGLLGDVPDINSLSPDKIEELLQQVRVGR